MLSFWVVEKSPPGVKNLFRGIPFSHENKIHEHILESLLLGRRTKENFACSFRSFLQVFERGLLQKISYFDGKERPIKAIMLLMKPLMIGFESIPQTWKAMMLKF